jgi:hypothetical protein
MDKNAQQVGQEAQDAQNATILALMKLIASIIGQASKRQIKLEDLTLMSGTAQAWPSDNPDLELTTKIKDAFVNPESKASVRIFLEYADGTKEQIFRQVDGKIPQGGDPFGLAPAMQKMFAEQAAQKFANPASPKVVVQVDPEVLLDQIDNISRTKGTIIDPTTLSKAETEVVSRIDSLQNSANVDLQNSSIQTSIKGGQGVSPTRADIFNAIPMSDEEIDSTLDAINQKMANQPPRSVDGPASTSATGKIIPANFGHSVANGLTQEKVLSLSDPRLKFAYLKAESLRQELNEYYTQAENPGYEYKLKLPIIDTLKKDLAKASSGVMDRLTELQKEGKWNPDAISSADSQTVIEDTSSQDKKEISSAKGAETANGKDASDKLAETIAEWPIGPITRKEMIEKLAQAESDLVGFRKDSSWEGSNYNVSDKKMNIEFYEKKVISYRAQLGIVEPTTTETVAFPSSAEIEQQMMMAIAPKLVSETAETALKPDVIPTSDKLSLDSFNAPAPTVAERNESFIMTSTMPTVANQNLIPVIQELKEVSISAPYDVSNQELTGNNTESAQLMAEVFALSAQIEGLRTQANQKLNDHSDFAKSLDEVAIDPQLKDWAASSTQTVQTQAVSIGDRLRNAASGLVDTFKERASNDWKIVVDTVKERASNDTQTVKEAIKTRLSVDQGSVKDTVAQNSTEGSESVQKASIESERVHKGIDTYIKHVGKSDPAGGVAEIDGYIFARLGEDRRIFRADTKETLYKGGLMTDKATSKDAAYLVRFPKVAEKAAAVAEMHNQSNQSQSSSNRSGASVKR